MICMEKKKIYRYYFFTVYSKNEVFVGNFPRLYLAVYIGVGLFPWGSLRCCDFLAVARSLWRVALAGCR